MTLPKRVLSLGAAIGGAYGMLDGLAVGMANGFLWENMVVRSLIGLIAGVGAAGLLLLLYLKKLTLSQVQKALLTGRHITGQLSEVNWWGPLNNEGLRGDWARLFFAWSLEQSPATLGTWSTHPTDGAPLVTITDPDYIHDLKSRPQYREALRGFRQRYPRLDLIRPGDRWEPWFQFTGKGTTTGDYTRVEWFLGSYLTTFIVTDIDAATRTVGVDVTIENTSSLQSGTRLPDTWQERGLPVSIIRSVPRDAFGPVEIKLYMNPITAGSITVGPIDLGTIQLGPIGLGGTFWQKFIWKDRISYEEG